MGYCTIGGCWNPGCTMGTPYGYDPHLGGLRHERLAEMRETEEGKKEADAYENYIKEFYESEMARRRADGPEGLADLVK